MLKLKKLDIDLGLDLTIYIPGEAGILDSTKKSPNEMFNWGVHCAKCGDEMQKQLSEESISQEEKVLLSRVSIIKQIDYFYDKGVDFWLNIPIQLLREVLTYLNDQALNAKKK